MPKPAPKAKDPQAVAKLQTVNAAALLEPSPGPLAGLTGSLVPAFSNALLNGVLRATWIASAEDQEAAHQRQGHALAALAAFAPKNEVEGMMAAQAVALHLAAMECARRAMHPDQPGDAASRLRRDAASLSRSMVEMAEAIDRRRGKGPQVVRVERVVVHEGGQAIVGNLTSGSGQGGGR